MGIRHVSRLFTAPQEAFTADIFKVVEKFPRFVDEEGIENLKSLVTFGEIEAILKCFEKEKDLGLDGWPVEFYFSFFYLIGQYLLLAIEYCRVNGRMV